MKYDLGDYLITGIAIIFIIGATLLINNALKVWGRSLNTATVPPPRVADKSHGGIVTALWAVAISILILAAVIAYH